MTRSSSQAAEVARHGKGAAAPPGDKLVPLLAAYYRHVSTERARRPLRRRRLRRLRVAPPPRCRTGCRDHQGPRLHADRRRARLVGGWALRRRGRHRRHVVPRRLTHDGAGATAPRRPPGAAPDARRASATTSGQLVALHPVSGRLGGAERGGDARVVDARGDRPARPTRSGEADRLADDVRRVLGDVRAAVEDWVEMRTRRRQVVADLEETRRRCPKRRSTRARRCSSGWPTSTSRSSATASTSWSRSDEVWRRRAAARRTSSARCPGSGLGILRDQSGRGAQVVVVQSSLRPGEGEGQGEEPAGAREGELAGDRAPARLSRLRRRQGLRCRWRGDRRAAVPRPAVERCLHRVGAAGAVGAREGRRGAGG